MKNAGYERRAIKSTICGPYRAAKNARMVYLRIRPRVRANRNFLSGYCIVPAATRNGTIGRGGGNSAGSAMAPKPHRLKISYALFNLCGGNRRTSVTFPPFRASR